MAEAELKAFSRSVKDSLDTSGVERFSEQSGRAFLKFGDDGKLASVRISSSTAQTRADLEQLERRTRTFADNLDTDFKRSGTAVIKLGEDGAAALGSFSTTVEDAVSPLQKFAGALTQTQVPLPLLGPQSLAAALAIGSLAVSLVAVLAPTIAFTIGLAGALTVLTAGATLAAAMAGGILLLGTRTAAGSAALHDMVADLSGMVEVLAGKVQPALAPVIVLVERLADEAFKLGGQLADGITERLPMAIQIVGDFGERVLDMFGRLGPVLAAFFDAFAARGPELEALFTSVMDGAVEAIRGLLSNLLRLTDWFFVELPTFGPLAQQTFDLIGQSVQGLISGLAEMAVIFATVDNAMLQLAGMASGALAPALAVIAQHQDVLRAATVGLTVALGALAVIALLPLVALGLLVANVILFVAAIEKLMDGFEILGGGVRRLVVAMSEGGGSINRVAQALVLVGNGVAAATGFLGGLIGKQGQATQTTGQFDIGMRQLQATIAQTTGSIDAQTSALQRQMDQVLGSIGADLQYQQSQVAVAQAADQVKQAADAAKQATAAYGASSDQAKTANDALRGATIGAEQAALQEAAAADNAAKKHAELTGTSYSARDSFNAQVGALQTVSATLAPGSALRAAIDGYIGQLNAIPRQIDTVLRLSGTIDASVIAVKEAQAGRASGGPVVPGRVYTVGEQGPETLIMGQHGGYVVPNGGGDTGGPGPSPSLSLGEVTSWLSSIDARLAQIAGQPGVSGAMATRRAG